MQKTKKNPSNNNPLIYDPVYSPWDFADLTRIIPGHLP